MTSHSEKDMGLRAHATGPGGSDKHPRKRLMGLKLRLCQHKHFRRLLWTGGNFFSGRGGGRWDIVDENKRIREGKKEWRIEKMKTEIQPLLITMADVCSLMFSYGVRHVCLPLF